MDDKDLRLKQAAKIFLKYMLDQAFFDLGSDQANADFKRFITRLNNPKSRQRSIDTLD